MDLKELRKEVHSLPEINPNLQKFQENWIKPLRANSNQRYPSLRRLDAHSQKEVNEKMSALQKNLDSFKQCQMVNNKLCNYSHYLIELKLTTLNGDRNKSKVIINRLLNDEFLKLENTIMDIQLLKEEAEKIRHAYNQINDILQEKLSLEETVFLQDSLHKKYLNCLLQTPSQQNKLIKQLGEHFVSLVKEIKSKHGR